MFCTQCAKEIPEGAEKCPSCGYAVYSRKKNAFILPRRDKPRFALADLAACFLQLFGIIMAVWFPIWQEMEKDDGEWEIVQLIRAFGEWDISFSSSDYIMQCEVGIMVIKVFAVMFLIFALFSIAVSITKRSAVISSVCCLIGYFVYSVGFFAAFSISFEYAEKVWPCFPGVMASLAFIGALLISAGSEVLGLADSSKR